MFSLLSRRFFALLAVLLGTWSTIRFWQQALTGQKHSSPDADSLAVFYGPFLIVWGVAMLAFRFDQLMMPSTGGLSRHQMTRLGWAVFVASLVAPAANFAIMLHLFAKD
jgi:hypothetical protein